MVEKVLKRVERMHIRSTYSCRRVITWNHSNLVSNCDIKLWFSSTRCELKNLSSSFVVEHVDVEQAPRSLQMKHQSFWSKDKNQGLKTNWLFCKKYFLDDKYPAFTWKRMTLLLESMYSPARSFFSIMNFVKSKTWTRVTDSRLENNLHVATSRSFLNTDCLMRDMKFQTFRWVHLVFVSLL